MKLEAATSSEMSVTVYPLTEHQFSEDLKLLEFTLLQITLDTLMILLLYSVTLIIMFVPTCTVLVVILFWETGVVHRITYRFSYFSLFFPFLLLVLFTNFILDTKKRHAV